MFFAVKDIERDEDNLPDSVQNSDHCSSDDDYSPDAAPSSDESSTGEKDVSNSDERPSTNSILRIPHHKVAPTLSVSPMERTKRETQPINCVEKEDKDASNSN